METPTEAVHLGVMVALREITTRRARQSPNAAPATEGVVEALSVEAMVVPEKRRGQERSGRAVTEGRNAPGKDPPAGGREGGVLLLPRAPVMMPAVSAVAVAMVSAAAVAAASVVGEEDERLRRGRSWCMTSHTCSDSTTAWRPRRTKTAQAGVTQG